MPDHHVPHRFVPHVPVIEKEPRRLSCYQIEFTWNYKPFQEQFVLQIPLDQFLTDHSSPPDLAVTSDDSTVPVPNKILTGLIVTVDVNILLCLVQIEEILVDCPAQHTLL